MYAGEDDRAALSETVFHTVPAVRGSERRPSAVLSRRYLGHLISTVAPARHLALIDLMPAGLGELGLDENAVITSPSERYPVTVDLARRLYRDGPPADGLVWRSRQDPERIAVVLYFAPNRRHAADRGAGVLRADLDVVAAPVPLLADEGMHRLLAVGNALDVTVVPPGRLPGG